MCSRTVSGTAYRFRHGSTLCSPTVEKILCRSPFRSGRMSAICARLSQKEVGVKRVETLVSTLLPRRGARRIPALRFSEKLSARQGRTCLRQFVCPAQPVLKKAAARQGRTRLRSSRTPAQPVPKKRLPPGQGEPAHAVCVPRLITARKRKNLRTNHTEVFLCLISSAG